LTRLSSRWVRKVPEIEPDHTIFWESIGLISLRGTINCESMNNVNFARSHSRNWPTCAISSDLTSMMHGQQFTSQSNQRNRRIFDFALK
jgi:hypothetical protein